MDSRERLVGIFVVGIVGLVALAIGATYLFRVGPSSLLASGLLQLLPGGPLLFFHAIALILMWIFGWFAALRVGVAIPMPLKIAVLAVTAGLYYLVSDMWVSLITQTLTMAGPDIFDGPFVFFVVLGSAALIMFIYRNLRSG